MQTIKKGLLLEGFLSVVLASLMFFLAGIRNGIFLLSMPFELIGAGLRKLSLSSGIGNVIAIFLFIMLSLFPVFYFIKKEKKTGLNKVDTLLPVISIYCFYMLYQFINPGLMINQMPDLLAEPSALPYIKLSLSILFYSLSVGYMILRMVKTLSTIEAVDKSNYLYLGLQKILFFVSILYTFFLGYFTTIQFFIDYQKNINEGRSALNTLFIIIKYFLENIPIFYTILILIAGIVLLKAMMSSQPGEEVNAANQLGMISTRTVYITVISNIVLNTLQFLLSKRLNDTDFNLEFSLFPLIISFSAMILSGYFKKTKDLSEDNELII